MSEIGFFRLGNIELSDVEFNLMNYFKVSRLNDLSQIHDFLDLNRQSLVVLLVENNQWKKLKEMNFSEVQKKSLYLISVTPTIEVLKEFIHHGFTNHYALPFNQNSLIVKLDTHLNELQRDSEFSSLKNLVVGENITVKQAIIIEELLAAPLLRVKRQDLCRKIWKDGKVSSKCLSVHVYNLRRVLSPMGYQIKYLSGGMYQLLKSDKKVFNRELRV